MTGVREMLEPRGGDIMDNEALLKELESLRERLAVVEHGQRCRSRRARRLLLVACAAVLVMAGGATAQSAACANGLPFCFSSDAPAIASEVNGNFAALKTWLEAKVGATGPLAGPVTDISTVGSVTARAFTPAFANWTTTDAGAGGASILNDNVSHRALMIVGNASSGSRTVKMFDNVEIGNGLAVTGAVNAASAAVGGAITAASLTVAGSVTSSGYQVSCANGENGYHFGFCCRMNIRNGATDCRHGTSTAFGSWANVTTPFAATTEGFYNLDCAGHQSAGNWPICCRTASNGTTNCVVSATGGALNWVATPNPW